MSVDVWHDEIARYERTGRLDQGPCWCLECIAKEDAERENGSER